MPPSLWQSTALMPRSKRSSTQPSISKNTLIEFLSPHKNSCQRAMAARDGTLDQKQFAALALDSDEHVKIALAKNSATPPLILAELACDHYFTVRFWVAKHNACPLYILKELMNDSVDVVSMAAKENIEKEK